MAAMEQDEQRGGSHEAAEAAVVKPLAFPDPPPGKTGWPWDTAQSSTTGEGPWPRVTIVTPSFNQGEFLEETIRSVLLQGYPNLEYIIMDGGSNDESVDIIRKYEPWLAYWESVPDRGQSHAINKGLERATGEYVAWLNSDDFYYPRAIVTAVEALQQSPEVGFVHSDYDYVDEQSRAIRRNKLAQRTAIDLLTKLSGIGQPAVFMRRKALEQVGVLREDLHMIMDYELWIRLLRSYPSKYVAGPPFAVARQHPAAKSVSSEPRRIPELVRVLDDIYHEPALENSLREVRRFAYGRTFMYAAVIEANRDHVVPSGLIWYAKALVAHPRLALARPLAPLWFLREGARETFHRVVRRKAQHPSGERQSA